MTLTVIKINGETEEHTSGKLEIHPVGDSWAVNVPDESVEIALDKEVIKQIIIT